MVRAMHYDTRRQTRETAATLAKRGFHGGISLTEHGIHPLISHIPPEYESGRHVLRDGGVVGCAETGFRIDWTVESLPVDDVKAYLRTKVASDRYAAEVSGTVWEGQLVRTDREARTALYQRSTWAEGSAWKFADGTLMALSSVQFEALRQAVTDHVQACFDRELALVRQIDEATTVEALDALDLTSPWDGLRRDPDPPQDFGGFLPRPA